MSSIQSVNFRPLTLLFNGMFQDLDDQEEFKSKYQELIKEYSNCSLNQRANYKGFLHLIEELAEYLMIPESFVKMKVTFIINWQQSTSRTNLVPKKRSILIPKFITSQNTLANRPNYPFTIDKTLSSLMTDYTIEFNRMKMLQEIIRQQESRAKEFRKQKSDVLKEKSIKTKNFYNGTKMDQAERRNLRIMSDLMYLIDVMNRDLKQKSLTSKSPSGH